MSKKKILFLFTFILFAFGCSFDNKTGIWTGSEDEKRRISDLEKKQRQIIDIEKFYSSDPVFNKEINLSKKINLSAPKKNPTWNMSGLNLQNFKGNLYLDGIENRFLKKQVGKNKHSIANFISYPLILPNSIVISDDKGSIFKISENGKIIWKKNIYKKIYKKIYKNLNFSAYQNKLYVTDNIGFIYSINLENGELEWLKNHGIPLKSNIKIFNNQIYSINQDNRLICLNLKDGSLKWDIRSISSFIKLQNNLSLAVTDNGNIITINSSGTVIKASADTGDIYWSRDLSGSMLADATDFFKISDIVLTDKYAIFSAGNSTSSYNLSDGSLNWEKNVISSTTPIIDKENIFLVTENGYFIILEMQTGEILSSANLLNILKKKKQETKISGFIMGSGKIYATTLNGYLIISSAISGKPEYFVKIGEQISSTPIISDGKLYILTDKPRIYGFN